MSATPTTYGWTAATAVSTGSYYQFIALVPPTWTAAQIKSALVNTANFSAPAYDDFGDPSNVLWTGSGLLDAGGAAVVLTNFSVARLFVNPARDRSSAYRDVINEAKQTARWQPLQAGDDAKGWSVLHPKPPVQFDNADDNALVFWREIKGHSILLLSTLGRRGQDSLVENNPNLRADIVVAGLPATDEPLSEPLLHLIQPKLIIILDSELPATRRAPAKLRQRLGNHGLPVIYCHDAGALKLSLWPGGWNVQNPAGQVLLRAGQ